ncbi:MAG: carbohydrate-binding family 9-like protein [Bryobacteraceae bacterium]|nr:carbohydrate-binding family 9-like protein [Bryobacteraceae bacterium]
MKLIVRCLSALLIAGFARAVFAEQGGGTMKSFRVEADLAPSADPDSERWKAVPGVFAERDPFGKPLPEARTEVRSIWTGQNLYFLFISRYETLYPRPNPTPEKEAWGLWDYDVVEVFIGSHLENINLYKEFEVSPDGEFIDLDVDRSRKGKEVDWKWNSGMRYKTQIDSGRKVWTCEMQIPWKSIDTRTPKPGNELRLNLYRIEGGPPSRKYIVWQPIHNPSYHTPERFGRLLLADGLR